MAVLNVHERTFPVPPDTVGRLIDSVAGPDDRLSPTPDWPPILFDRPLGVGAVGGHGPIRYTVEAYVPGRWIRFAFTAPAGFHGFHEFTAHDEAGVTTLRHTLAMRTRGSARLSWPLAFRWLHDAMLEDSLDRAEQVLTGTVASKTRWSRRVRLLRRLVGRLMPPQVW
ncbi:MAG: SRPBCC family protein [Kutzneria sp.]|nr:SRPBCC family protein [Kutzneria sp.]